MSNILLILVLAVTTEALLEYLKQIAKAFNSKEWKVAITQLAAIVVSICLCLTTKADLYKALNVNFSLPYIGIILTGIFGSRGANYVSDFIKKVQNVGVVHKNKSK